MTFPIEDQLIKEYELGGFTGSSSSEVLISDMFIMTVLFGVSYNEGILTIKNLKGKFTEAFVENGVLKLK